MDEGIIAIIIPTLIGILMRIITTIKITMTITIVMVIVAMNFNYNSHKATKQSSEPRMRFRGKYIK